MSQGGYPTASYHRSIADLALRYFDGSWKNTKVSVDHIQSTLPIRNSSAQPSRKRKVESPVGVDDDLCTSSKAMHGPRFIGAFGVEGWATRSGTKLLVFGESVNIERQKMQLSTSAKGKGRSKSSATIASRRKTSDIVVRFTNSRGDEVGRLAQDKAAFISTLLDQKVCVFVGTCFYAPERIRTNDTIHLQLRCFLLPSAFVERRLRPANDNRITDLFAAAETEDEKALRLRQIALVKIFEEVNLHPVRTHEITEKHKRTGLLQAAEMAEVLDNVKEGSGGPGKDATPSNVEDAEDNEGKELEQDQLDALYRKLVYPHKYYPDL